MRHTFDGSAIPVDSTDSILIQLDKYRIDMSPMKPNTKRLAKIMKALANEHRLALYVGIAQNQESDFETPECTVSEIVKAFTLSAPTICHHLKELANADLISTERRGKYLVARINRQTVREVEEVIGLVKGG